MFAVAADLLTLSRLIAAGILVWLGFQGADTLSTAIVVGVVAWMTDQLDGWAARRAKSPTRMAPFDFLIDSILYAGTLAYLTLAGFLPAVPVLVFSLIAVVAALVFRHKAVDLLSVRLIDLASVVVISGRRPPAALFLIIWLLVSAFVYRRRLAERVPRWFSDLARCAGFRGSAR